MTLTFELDGFSGDRCFPSGRSSDSLGDLIIGEDDADVCSHDEPLCNWPECE